MSHSLAPETDATSVRASQYPEQPIVLFGSRGSLSAQSQRELWPYIYRRTRIAGYEELFLFASNTGDHDGSPAIISFFFQHDLPNSSVMTMVHLNRMERHLSQLCHPNNKNGQKREGYLIIRTPQAFVLEIINTVSSEDIERR